MADKLKVYRIKKDMNLEDVSKLTGFSEAKLSRIESGAAGIKLQDAFILCDLYDIDNPRDVMWYYTKNR